NDLRRVAELVRAGGAVAPRQLLEHAKLSKTRLLSAVGRLEDVGALTVAEDAVRWRRRGPAPDVAAARAAAAEESHRAVEKSRVEMVRAYAESRTCRRQVLLAYFGEHLHAPCGNCDVCDAGRSQPGEPPDHHAFAPSSRVHHDTFGDGQVLQVEGDRVTVLFDEVGYKTLSAAAVTE